MRPESRAFGCAFLILLISLAARADWTGAQGRMSIQADSFLSPDYTATEARQFHYFSAGLRTAGLEAAPGTEGLESGLQASIDGQFSPEAPVLSYLNIRQLYHRESMLVVGRKIENWSGTDERWNLGLYQPQFRWNPLLPESQGLSGIFIFLQGESETLPWGLLLFASGVYIPDQGAGYAVRDGRFEQSNPWFRPPPSRAVFSTTGAEDELRYNVRRPETNRIVFNPSYASRVFIGDVNRGASVQAAYAYKPANQLVLGLNGQIKPDNAIDIDVNPTFFYHSLISADVQYSGSLFEAGAGVLREKPQAPEFEKEWTYPVYGESVVASPFVGMKLRNFKVRFMSLFVNEEDSTAAGPKAQELKPILGSRFPFRNAHAVEASARHYWRRHEGFSAKARVSQGAEDEFTLFSGSLNYQLDSRWSMGAQILLVRGESAQTASRTVYSDFENNDAGQVGVLYVF